MKYFLAVEDDGTRHIVAAHNEQNAMIILSNCFVTVNYMYELTADTFKYEGFLISDEKIAPEGV